MRILLLFLSGACLTYGSDESALLQSVRGNSKYSEGVQKMIDKTFSNRTQEMISKMHVDFALMRKLRAVVQDGLNQQDTFEAEKVANWAKDAIERSGLMDSVRQAAFDIQESEVTRELQETGTFISNAIFMGMATITKYAVRGGPVYEWGLEVITCTHAKGCRWGGPPCKSGNCREARKGDIKFCAFIDGGTEPSVLNLKGIPPESTTVPALTVGWHTFHNAHGDYIDLNQEMDWSRIAFGTTIEMSKDFREIYDIYVGFADPDAHTFKPMARQPAKIEDVLAETKTTPAEFVFTLLYGRQWCSASPEADVEEQADAPADAEPAPVEPAAPASES